MRIRLISALWALVFATYPAFAQEVQNRNNTEFPDTEAIISEGQDPGAQDPQPNTNIVVPGQRQVVQPTQEPPPTEYAGPTPFAYDLFTGQFSAERGLTINPDYVVKPGDQILVRMWGAQSFEGVQKVDLQGNIFLPEVGPIPVDGIRNAELQPRILSFVRRVFTERVQVYTNLLSTQPVGVFVTGAVNQPGHYAGDRTDSPLYYLDRARGIDPERGSFRNVRVIRRGRVVAVIDLYEFKTEGRMPAVQMEAGDRIVVEAIGNTFVAIDKVRNVNRFEFRAKSISGNEAIRLAQPTPRASHVSIRGLRNGRPFNTYVSLKRFRSMRVYDGDRLRFSADHPDGNFFVHVIGQKAGPSTFAINAGTTLNQVLNLVEVDPHTAALHAIYLRRDSIARLQTEALKAALRDLERSTLTATSESGVEVGVRVQEAQMVERFIAKARTTKMEGRVIVNNTPAGRNIHLEPNDVIVIPLQSNLVSVGGEVLIPQTVVHVPGQPVKYYVKQSGGLSDRAHGGRPVVLRLDGSIVTGYDARIYPGDEIRILAAPDPKMFARIRDLVEVVYRIALSSAALVRAF